MKVLHFIPVFYPAFAFGGIVRSTYESCKELARRGHEVTVYTTNAFDQMTNFEPRKRSLTLDGMKVFYFDNTFRFDKVFLSYSMISALNGTIKEFDIVHIHSWRQPLDVIICRIARKYGVPYIVQAHGSLPRIMSKRGLKWVFDLLFGPGILSGASKVIAINTLEAQQYMGMNVPSDKIEVIPHGMDLSSYRTLPPKGSFKRRFSIGNKQKIALYLGRINRIKGIDILVEAFADVVRIMKDARLVVVGPDDGYLEQLKALIKSLDLEKHVQIVGPLYGKEKLEAYVDADVCVLPSRYEIFSMTVLESVACGTPVVLTENCGIKEYIRDKVGLVTPGNPKHLREALLDILQDQSKRESFSRRCTATVETFNIAKTVRNLEAVYEMVGGGARNQRKKIVREPADLIPN